MCSKYEMPGPRRGQVQLVFAELRLDKVRMQVRVAVRSPSKASQGAAARTSLGSSGVRPLEVQRCACV